MYNVEVINPTSNTCNKLFYSFIRLYIVPYCKHEL